MGLYKRALIVTQILLTRNFNEYRKSSDGAKEYHIVKKK